MRFIHCADLHLDSKMTSNLSREQAKERKMEILRTYSRMIDYAKENKNSFENGCRVLHMWDASTGMIDTWHKYCQKQMRDSYHILDEKLLFANDGTNKKDYASKRLSYLLEPGECPAYEQIISTLYSEEERRKIEWAIGSIVTGESRALQKFLVLYGGPGTGKSTMLNIIQDLFEV